jgi:hypothetical protein
VRAKGSEYTYHYGNKTTRHGVQIAANADDNTEVDYSDNGANTYYVPSEETPMPMFGCKVYNTSDIDTSVSSGAIDLGTISMIRSMAKLIVKNSTKYKIDGVKLKYYYDLGMCGLAQPSGGSLYTKGTNPGDYNYNYTVIEELGLPGAFTRNFTKGYNDENPIHRCENLPFQEYTNSKGEKMFVAYIPAYNNKLTHTNIPAVPSQILVTIKGLDYPIEFQTQDSEGNYDGVYYDLWRNHMYIYDITKAILDTRLLYVVTKFDEYTASDITFN